MLLGSGSLPEALIRSKRSRDGLSQRNLRKARSHLYKSDMGNTDMWLRPVQGDILFVNYVFRI